MRPYVVKQGEYLDKIAHVEGFDAEQVWKDPKNAELSTRRDPNFLHPGDILHVPALKKPNKWLPLNISADNLFVAKVPWTVVSLVFKDLDRPRANEPCVVHGLGEPEEGATTENGGLEVKVPVHVREIHVVFPKSNVTYPIHIGDMDPIDEPTGVRKRLRHLGYYVEPSADGAEGDAENSERAAIHAFQVEHGLLPTGMLDDETKAKLLDEHGG